MPTYQYVCTACAERLEVVQAFADDPLTECPACGGRLRKVFSPVGVVFKGSGFYKTDSRAAARKSATRGESAADADGADGKGTGKPGAESAPDTSTEPKPATKPAAEAGAGKAAGSGGKDASASPAPPSATKTA